jgi:hypothetical protein
MINKEKLAKRQEVKEHKPDFVYRDMQDILENIA